MGHAHIHTPSRRWLTRHDYHRMADAGILTAEDHVELIQGELVNMPPIGSHHAGNVTRLNQLFSSNLMGLAQVSVQNPVVLGQHSEPEPDLMLLKPREDFYTRAHPQPEDVLLIVEVAESSLHYDLQTKVPLYAEYAIPEVWVLDLNTPKLYRYWHVHNGHYQNVNIFEHAITLAPEALPDVQIAFDFLFSER